MEKSVAIDILEEIQTHLQDNDLWKEKSLKAINIYIKNLRIATCPKIKELIEQQKQSISKYGEFDKHTIRLNKKIDKEIHKIFND